MYAFPAGYQLPYPPPQPVVQSAYPALLPPVKSGSRRTIHTTPEFLGYSTCADVNQEADSGNRLRLCNALKTRSGARRCQYNMQTEQCSNTSSAIMQTLDELDETNDPQRAKLALVKLSKLASKAHRQSVKSPSMISGELEGYLDDIEEDRGNVWDVFTAIIKFIRNTIGEDTTSYLWKLLKMVFAAWFIGGSITIGPIRTMIKLMEALLPDSVFGLIALQKPQKSNWEHFTDGVGAFTWAAFSLVPSLQYLWYVSSFLGPLFAVPYVANVLRVVITAYISYAYLPSTGAPARDQISEYIDLALKAAGRGLKYGWSMM